MSTLIGAAEPPEEPDPQSYTVPMSITCYPLACPTSGLLFGCRCQRCRPDLHMVVPSTTTNTALPVPTVLPTTTAPIAAGYVVRWV